MDAKLTYTGANGSALDLFDNPYFILTHVDGLTGVSSSVSSSTTPGMDGDTVNNIQTQPRSIVMDLRIRPGVIVEEAKRYILRAIKPKQSGSLRLIYRGRDIQISGIIAEVKMPRFTDTVIMQVTLYCSQPYWRDAEYIALEIARFIDLHYFPIEEGGLAFPEEGLPFGEYNVNMTQTFTNDGDADCGMLVTIIAFAAVSNPTIYKSDGSYIGIIDDLSAGDEVVINTNRGEKSVTKNGESIFSKLRPGSVFLQMEPGDNEFTIDSEDGTEGNMYFTLTFKRRFV